jgi:hypothetical protein
MGWELRKGEKDDEENLWIVTVYWEMRCAAQREQNLVRERNATNTSRAVQLCHRPIMVNMGWELRNGERDDAADRVSPYSKRLRSLLLLNLVLVRFFLISLHDFLAISLKK